MMTNQVQTTCPYCGVGCGLVAETGPAGVVNIQGDVSHPANLGRLCSKGAALAETLDLNGRLLQPKLRGQSTSWDAALDAVAQGFNATIAEHGPDAVAFYVSGQLLTEDYYVANKLMKGFIGSANIDTNSRLCMSSSVAGHKRAFGSDTVPACYEDLELADLVVLTGSNMAWCHPVLYQRLRAAKKARPSMKVVVIDPRRTASCDIADLHLPLQSGTDTILFSGLLNWLSENGRMHRSFIDRHTRGLDHALQQARWHVPAVESVAAQCGLDVSSVTTFFQWFSATEKTVTAYSQGVNQSSSGTDKVNSIINCHLLTGRIGLPGSGPLSLTGQPNAMGGREVGALANQLAAHMSLEDEAHRDRVQRFWQATNLAHGQGLMAVEMFRAIEAGQIKAIWIMATNPAVSLPDAGLVRRALDKCPLVVVSDCVEQTDTTQYADVLLPALAWGEKDGSVTNSERRISRQRAFLPPPGQAKPDWWIISQVATRMGCPGFAYEDAYSIFMEHARLSAFENNGERNFDLSALTGLNEYEYIQLPPLQWPLRHGMGGTRRLFADGRFFTDDRRARFVPVTPHSPVHLPDAQYPMILNTGRMRDHWHTMTRTGKSPRLSGHDTEPLAELHPDDAGRLGINDGELVKIHSRWGDVLVRARLSLDQHHGHVFVPMHWNNQYASNATIDAIVNPHVDPISGQPEFKHTPVSVTAYRPAWHGFLLSRRERIPDNATYWCRAWRDGLWHYELAGEQVPSDWPEFARQLLCETDTRPQWAELRDSAGSYYRSARFVDQRLESCLFIGPDIHLPQRDWLVKLFAQNEVQHAQRVRLLAGSPGKDQADTGKTICACFGVGRNTLIDAIHQHGLDSVEAIGDQLQAGTNCGSCIPELRALIDEVQSGKNTKACCLG